jgi:hypothetical protein
MLTQAAAQEKQLSWYCQISFFGLKTELMGLSKTFLGLRIALHLVHRKQKTHQTSVIRHPWAFFGLFLSDFLPLGGSDLAWQGQSDPSREPEQSDPPPPYALQLYQCTQPTQILLKQENNAVTHACQETKE